MGASLRNFDWALPMYKDEELDEDFKEQIEAHRVAQEVPGGEGLPESPRPGSWRPYLFEQRSAIENLEEIHSMLGLVKREVRQITKDQLIEGVRRALVMKYHPLVR